MESLISPSGTVRGLLGESPLYGDYIGSPSGLLGDSLGTGRTSATLGLIPKESLGTPQRLFRDSSGTPWTTWGLPSNLWLSVTTSKVVSPRFQLSSIQNATVLANTETKFLLVQRLLAIAIFELFDLMVISLCT